MHSNPNLHLNRWCCFSGTHKNGNYFCYVPDRTESCFAKEEYIGRSVLFLPVLNAPLRVVLRVH